MDLRKLWKLKQDLRIILTVIDLQDRLVDGQLGTITTKCYFIVLFEVNEYSLTVNIFINC